jgi:hypothetical protein
MGLVDHRFALVPFTRPSASNRESFFIVSSPILACSSAMLVPSLLGLLSFSEDAGCAIQEPALPLGDLIGMNIEPLGDYDEGLFTFDGFQSRLG